MPWYWILIILSAVVGPFEAMHALNKARQNREQAEKRKNVSGACRPDGQTGPEQSENREGRGE